MNVYRSAVFMCALGSFMLGGVTVYGMIRDGEHLSLYWMWAAGIRKEGQKVVIDYEVAELINKKMIELAQDQWWRMFIPVLGGIPFTAAAMYMAMMRDRMDALLWREKHVEKQES